MLGSCTGGAGKARRGAWSARPSVVGFTPLWLCGDVKLLLEVACQSVRPGVPEFRDSASSFRKVRVRLFADEYVGEQFAVRIVAQVSLVEDCAGIGSPPLEIGLASQGHEIGGCPYPILDRNPGMVEPLAKVIRTIVPAPSLGVDVVQLNIGSGGKADVDFRHQQILLGTREDR